MASWAAMIRPANDLGLVRPGRPWDRGSRGDDAHAHRLRGTPAPVGLIERDTIGAHPPDEGGPRSADDDIPQHSSYEGRGQIRLHENEDSEGDGKNRVEPAPAGPRRSRRYFALTHGLETSTSA